MVRSFVLLFSFSIFSDRRSLKIKNENNLKTLMQKFDRKKNLTYGIIETHFTEQVLVRHGKRVIRVRSIEVLLYSECIDVQAEAGIIVLRSKHKVLILLMRVTYKQCTF